MLVMGLELMNGPLGLLHASARKYSHRKVRSHHHFSLGLCSLGFVESTSTGNDKNASIG